MFLLQLPFVLRFENRLCFVSFKPLHGSLIILKAGIPKSSAQRENALVVIGIALCIRPGLDATIDPAPPHSPVPKSVRKSCNSRFCYQMPNMFAEEQRIALDL